MHSPRTATAVSLLWARYTWQTLLFVSLMVLSTIHAWAVDNQESRASLRGLSGIGLLIGALDAEIERGGLTREQIQTEVQQRLRRAGIPLLSKEEAAQRPGAPFLAVSVNTIRHPMGLYAYSIDVVLYQSVTLVRDATSASVPTWSTGTLGIVPSKRLAAILKSTAEQVEQFIRAYRTMHPRADTGAAAASRPPASAQRRLIRQVQKRLQDSGFPPGALDGTLGSQTHKALRQYQRKKGLPTTGKPDAATLKALGVR